MGPHSCAPVVNMDDYDMQGCLHDMFVKQARATPESVAIVTHDGQKVCYGELDRITDILALRLRHLGVKRNTVVGILMDRCLEYAVSYIAILKAGGAYMPLEVSYPESLLQSVIKDAQPVAICTKHHFCDRLQGEMEHDRILILEKNWAEELQDNNQYSPITEPVQVGLDDMAYTVYSSGTTGKPKGIRCPHRGAVFSYHWRHLSYPYQTDDREACNVFFVWEMLRPLLKGVPMYIIPDDVIYDPPRLVEFLGEHKITRMLFTPSLLQAILDFKGLPIEKGFENMRQIWFCGEVVTMILKDRFSKLFPQVRMLNLYSVSECHDIACADLSEFSSLDNRKFCPVGRLLPGVHIVIMDEKQNIQPVGAPGEIYVGGPTLAIGYLNRPELNATRFIPCPPQVPVQAGPRLYRTGDWGYMLTDGNLEICGRCDSMVKIRGYSIELQAVETALLDLPMVNTGCVLALGDEGSEKFLVAYIVPEGKTSQKEVQLALKRMLPFYMIPSKFVFLSSIPILESSGKLDKKALPRIDTNADNEMDLQDLPSTHTEKLVASIWCKILKLSGVDMQSNFFDLGGHSLQAVQLLSEVNSQLGIQMTIKDLLNHPTVSSMVSYVEDPNSAKKEHQMTMDLKAEVERHDHKGLLMDIRLRAFWRSFQLSQSKWHRDKILLTGVTGFLGSFLLKELLMKTEATVYCLVRNEPKMTLISRIKEALRQNGIMETCNEDEEMSNKLELRVIPIKGDISLTNLGMTEEEYMYLSYEIDTIIHAAANVNLIFPYQALHSANVVGTENVVLFAADQKIKPVHYISTNAVFPQHLINCFEDMDVYDYADKLEDGYSQSKWVAEQLVLQAQNRGLPAAVYRCGNVTGSMEIPSWNPRDFILLMFKACIDTQTAPDIDWQIELTPVDFVSKFIVDMMQDVRQSIGKIFHVINTNTMDCRLFWKLLRDWGYPLEVIPYEEWYKRVQEMPWSREDDEKSNYQNYLVDLLNIYIKDASFFSSTSTYTRENLETVLQLHELDYPKVNVEIMKKYLQDLVKINLIPQPSQKYRGTAGLLQGQVALVTGASSGIGAAIAENLAKAGAKVALAARRLHKLQELQKEIAQQGGTAICVEMDVYNEPQVKKGVQQIESVFGPIDILINNAGVMYYTLMKNIHLNEWKNMVNVNINGALNCIAAVLGSMVERKHGHIVNITSDAGRKAFPGLAVYSGTKFFLEAMSASLRQEMVNERVKVTCIQPGDVKTELQLHSTDQQALNMYDMSTKMQILDATDVAQAVIFALAQPEHCAINEILLQPREAPL